MMLGFEMDREDYRVVSKTIIAGQCLHCVFDQRKGGENLNSKRHIGGQTDQYKIRLGGPHQILYWSAARQYLFLAVQAAPITLMFIALYIPYKAS